MKRKLTLDLKIPAPRNPFVVAAKMKKAGAHRKTEKAVRRAEKVDLVRGRSSTGFRALGFYPSGSRFDPERPHHEDHCRKRTSLSRVFFSCPSGGIGRHGGLKIRSRKACRFESGVGHQNVFSPF